MLTAKRWRLMGAIVYIAGTPARSVIGGKRRSDVVGVGFSNPSHRVLRRRVSCYNKVWEDRISEVLSMRRWYS